MVRGTKVVLCGAALLSALAAAACAKPRESISRDPVAARVDERYAAGAAAWGKYCALCHARDAQGYAADHAPSLVSATFLESASDEFIARGIREGRPGTAMAAYGKARGGPLDEDDIAAILTFLRDQGAARVPLPLTSAPVHGDQGAARVPLPLTSAPVHDDPERGQVVYDAHCRACHGTRTDRATAVHLANPALLSAASDAFLRHAVVHGRPGTPMPAFSGALTGDEIDDVVALLRSWARPLRPERRAPPEPPPIGEPVIHPSGRAPDFTLRSDLYVPIADVKKALDEGRRIVIIDARAPSDWYAGHIPGSISVPYYSFSRLDSLPKDGTWITAYCACPHHASGAVVAELRKRGFPHTAILDEGILEWKKRGYPMASEDPPPE